MSRHNSEGSKKGGFFLIEPMALVGGKDKDDRKYYMLPAYEVTVTVTVEHNGRTFMYSRTYLPEYVTCRASELEKVYNTIPTGVIQNGR